MAELDPVTVDVNMRQNISEESERASASIAELRKNITIQKKVIADLEQQYVRAKKAFDEVNIGTQNEALIAQKKQASDMLKQVRQELANEKSALEQLTEALNEEEKALQRVDSARSGYHTGFMQGVRGLAGAFSAATGVAALFGAEEEKLAAIQTKLQAAMAITSGLASVQKTLYATSASSMNLASKAGNLYAKSLRAIRTASGAVAGVLAGALVTGITLAISAWRKWREEQEEVARLNKIVTDSLQDAAAEGAKSAHKETTQLKLLYAASQDEKRSKQERLDAIKQLKKDFPGYFSNISDEEFMAGKAASAYEELTRQIIAAAKARAAADKITENEAKILDFEAKRTELDAKRIQQQANWQKANSSLNKAVTGGGMDVAQVQYLSAAAQVARSEYDKLGEEITDVNKKIGKLGEANKKLAARISATDLTFAGKSTGGDKGKENKLKNDLEELAKLQEKYAHEAEERATESRIAAMNDGYAKQLEELKKNYAKRLATIAQEQAKLDKLEKTEGVDAVKSARAGLDNLAKQEAQKFAAEQEALAEKYNAELDGIMNGMYSRFASRLEREMQDINAYYDERIAKARAAGATETQIAELEAAREKEINTARLEDALRVFDFKANLAARQMETIRKTYFFQADRERALLELQKKQLLQRKRILENKSLNEESESTAEALEEVNARLEEVNANIKKTPVKKLEEITDMLSATANSLDKMFGTGELFGKLSELGDIATSIATGDYPGAVVGGVNFIASLFDDGAEEAERLRKIQQELLTMQLEYERSLRRQKLDLIDTVDYFTVFKNDLQTLHWLSQNGFISEQSYSAWNAANKQFEQANANLAEVIEERSKLVSDANTFIMASELIGNLGVGLIDNDSLKVIAQYRRGEIDQLETLRRLVATGFVSAEYVERMEAADEEIQELTDSLAELRQQLEEYATGTSFDSFLQSASDAIYEFRNDVSGLADFTEDALTNAILSSFRYQMLSDVMKSYYEELATAFIDGTADKSFADSWRERLQATMAEQAAILNDIFGDLGVTPTDDSTRTGASAGLERISQDSANELNGNFYALRQQVGDIRNLSKEAGLQREAMRSLLSRIADNTEYCRYLETINSTLSVMQTYGVKLKS
jgi:HAMP domain-containing protein